jgi:NAD(P)H-flavin reductase
LQSWATITAVAREIGYPQLHIPFRHLSFLSPPSTGRIIFLLCYWAIIIYMMVANAILRDFNFWERIGFRNAWVTVMQVPLLYLLASRCSLLGFLAGTSYERLNWFHRWVGRTMFVTATVHGFHFYTEYVKAGLFNDMVTMMPMIKYGLGAWAVLLWTLVSSFAPFRHMAYEIFVVQHIVSAVLFLWLIYVHVPVYARYNVWFAIAALSFDRVYRTTLLVWQNIKIRPKKGRCAGGQRLGHQAQVRAVGDSIAVVTIKDVHFKWRAGQHLYLWMPRIGPMEAHPYTIASAHQLPETCVCNSIQLVVRKHSGFSKRLYDSAAKAQAAGKKVRLTAFVSGPYGLPPRWDIYETLILISASTGASFTLPILESVLTTKKSVCTKRIDFLLAAKQGEEIDFYVHRLHELIARAKDVGIELLVHVAVTRSGAESSPFANEAVKNVGSTPSIAATTGSVSKDISTEKATETSGSVGDIERSGCCSSRKRISLASQDSQVFHTVTRPDIETFIRRPVEATGGETSVVVCGGKSLVAKVRNCVAALSDERAVHKGTGAQGIHLHVEEYCF